jgi:amino acid adenylation domain-containing protein
VGGETLTFTMLHDRAAGMAATLQKHTPAGGSELTAVFAYRSATAFTGVLAALLRGHGYVPLNRTFPADRTRLMLERSGARAVIVDSASAEQLDVVLERMTEPILVVLPDEESSERFARRWPDHRVVAGTELEPAEEWSPVAVSEDAGAYLLFTSGSTGVPKGVLVTHGNVRHLVDVMVERYGVTEQDRFSQMFDMTFDLSVFDMFVAWEAGACVCCPSAKSLLGPAEFIRSSELTLWFSVPSAAMIMRRLGMLKPDSYPSLRWSLFCGEPLPMDVTGAWAAAAPNSVVENLYGPTEATVACTLYRWDPARSPEECVLGLVPIGAPVPGMDVSVVDDQLQPVAPGEDGELLLSGPQVTPGYWRDPEKTAAAFVVPPGQEAIHYRTGDRVRSSAGGTVLHYLGRLDNQIKVHGHRVELGEVEAAVRKESGVDAVVALGWPRIATGAGGIVAFLGATDVDIPAVQKRLTESLPDYMRPRRFILLEALPVNSNGKFDRKALLSMLEGQIEP